MIPALQPTVPPSSGTSARRANALPSGYLLDEYRIDAILGAGGFGVTYKALDTHLEAWVAIKEYFPVEWSFRDADGLTVYPNTQGQASDLKGQESDYRWGLERFLDEARVLAQIQHPYVVRVRRYFRAHGTAYIVMDYEEGEPLSAILRDGETLDERQVRGLLEDILPALQAVHEQGYLHRDIKPANLYLRSADHRVMLIDFGAARVAVGRHSKSVTSLVTPGYSPPEQYTTRNDRYGTWTDLYALGAVLYRCVTGHVPMEAAERMLDDQMEPATQAGKDRYSRNLLRVIDQALAVRAEQRFRTVAEMQSALSGASDECSDETVVLRPLLAKPGAPARETGPPRLTERPVASRVEQLIDASLLEITQPPAGPSSPADSLQTVARPQKNAEMPTHRPPPGLLIGGGAVATLAALLVWFWPLTLERKPVSPPHFSVTQTESPVAKTADGDQPLPESSESFSPNPTARGGEVDASLAEPPAVMEPAAPPPGVETEIPKPFLASPDPGATAPVGDFVAAEPDAWEPEPVQDVEASLPEADDALARSLPDPPDQDAASAAETPAAPTTAGAVGGPPPAAARSRTTSEPVAGRKPPPRRTRATATSRSQPRKASPGKSESRAIVITPPEWKKQSRARARKNPWQPPTDTGFNQK